jgi:hypothetical protein
MSLAARNTKVLNRTAKISNGHLLCVSYVECHMSTRNENLNLLVRIKFFNLFLYSS